MRFLFIVFLLSFPYFFLSAQGPSPEGNKPPVDLHMLDNWPKVEHPVIANNGRYALYVITNQPQGSNTLVVLSTDRSWQKQMIVATPWINGLFSEDSKRLAFLNGDTLRILALGKEDVMKITNVRSLKYPEGGKGEWLAYQLGDPSGELVLMNLLTDKVQRITSVEDYSFDNSGKALVIKRDSAHILQWLNLADGQARTIWHSDTAGISMFNIDGAGKQLAFTVTGADGEGRGSSIYYYREGMDQAELKVTGQTQGMTSDVAITGHLQFSKNGRWIFFQIQPREKAPVPPREGAASVTVWGYRDPLIQPEQSRILQGDPASYAAVIGVSDKKVLRIEKENEFMNTSPETVTGDFVVVNDQQANITARWKFAVLPSFYLVSLKDGARTLLKKNSWTLFNFSFSPQGKYLVYYDEELQQFFSYELKSGLARNVTKTLPRKLSREVLNFSMLPAVDDVAGWEANDNSFLIYDNYDIWKIDPASRNAPVCVTNGFGNRSRNKLRLFDNAAGYSEKDTFLLTGFDVVNKYNGFFQMDLVGRKDPTLLTMGPYTYYRVPSQKPYFSCLDNGLKPVKARSANVWLVKRQSATEAPNFFITSDLRSYSPLSDLHPENAVNWLTSELVTWKQQDGIVADGILYKPANFDPKKKYPVIFNYYRQYSHTLYEFPYPYFIGANINIPWFVSNGYLVFIPDINYKEKVPPVRSAYNAIVSAAQHLSALPFVDPGKIGLQGHSWGGGQTNYVITHTGMFAAAAEFAGVTDNISSYLTLVPFASQTEHLDRYLQTEHAYGGGATLWEEKETYIESNAVLNADKITTPLLITHNKRDNQIAYRQGVELYMALRRLGRTSWMLEYENGRHGLVGDDSRDFTIRLTQFFDHYLKGRPAPVWMTQGMPAGLTRKVSGFELDPQNSCGKECPVCNSHQMDRSGRPKVLGR